MRRMLPLALLGLLVGVGSLLAAETAATIKKLDADKGTIVVTAKGKDYTLTIAKDVKVLGADGKALADGINSKEVNEGVEATINYQRDGSTHVLNEIRLGKGQEKRRKPNADPNASQEGKPNIGLKPLNEMTAEDRYKGEDGGLYGGGQNEPPSSLLAAAKAETAKIVPLDEKGQPSKDGKIGLISLSYSNATREFAYFKPIADADPQKSPFVQIVDCSQSGQAMEKWADPKGKPWMVTHQRLASAKLSPEQVQVVWAKIATIQPNGDLSEHGKRLQKDTTVYLQNAHAHFPNLRIVYFSSRTYGGWTNTLLNPEPYTYENGFVIRWLIQAQMDGDPELNPDPAKGPVKAPLLLWGPYLWGDGATPRQSDGLVWERKDFVEDGTHVSESGKQKVCDMLLKHFKEDALCKTWYVRKVYYDRGAEERKVQQKQRGQPQAKQPPSAEEELKWATREAKDRAAEAFAVSEQACPLETIEVPAAEGHKVLGVLRKPPGPGPFPALVHLHGTLDIKSLASLQAWTRDATASRFLAAGYVLVTPTFRSRTEDPQTRDALLDCLTMIDYVKKRPDVDPQSVVVWGDSGGGSLALELAGETDLAAIAAQEPATILMTGMLSKEHPGTGPLMQDPKKYWTPELQEFTREKIRKIHCPVFIAYGDKSKINHEIVIPELQAAGKQLETKLYPGKAHGFSKYSEEFFNDCDKFFRKSLETSPKPIAGELIRTPTATRQE